MNHQYSTPDDDREWVPADWQDDDTYLLAASVETEANYYYAAQED